MGTGFDFRLLGALAVTHNGKPVPVNAAKQRVLLAALLINANRPVPIEALVSHLWGPHPPAGARTTVQNYVMRLRHVFTQSAGECPIFTRPEAYLVATDDGGLDLQRFQSLVQQARNAVPDDAAKLLCEALSLWRGDPLSDIPSESLRRDVVPGLVEQRLAAVEMRFEVDLQLGRHQDVIGELREFTTHHQLRERFWAQLIIALYRSGRQAEALQAFHDLRDALSDELGIDPSPELQELHQRVLTADPALTPVTVRAPLPRQLPAPSGLFIGRSTELAALTQLVEQSSTVVISAIGGSGGIGKTSLALRWAHQNLDRFPDGQLFVNLRGFDPSGPPMSSEVAVRGFLEALGVAPSSIPVDQEAQSALYRSLVAGKRMLIVLDNARDTNHLAPLLPGSPSCTVLATSRHQLGGLLTAHHTLPLALDVLDDGEARDLLARHLGTARVTAEPEAVDEILDRCAGLPLALSIVAARAANYPDFPLSLLSEELHDATARLDALDAGDLSANLRAVFACSYNALKPEVAGVFGLLGLAPGPDISLPAAASLTALSVPRVRSLLRELENAHLITQHVPGRYRMHDLVRLYAEEHDLTEQARSSALRRLVDFYLHTSHSAELLLYPHFRPIELDDPVAGFVPQPLEDLASALSWFDTEHGCLLAVFQLAVRQGWDTLVWQLVWSVTTFHWRRARLRDDLAAWRAGLTAALHLGSVEKAMIAHRLLGRACTRAGLYSEAVDHLSRALVLAERVGDTNEEAHVHHTLAWCWEQQSDDRQAMIHSTHALRLFRELNDQPGEAKALNSLGWYHARLGDFEQARACCEQAVMLEDAGIQPGTIDSLGYIALNTGHHREAFTYYEQALKLNREIGSTYDEANTLAGLGEASAALGDGTGAGKYLSQALDLYRIQHRPADVERVQRLLDALDAER